jgi:PAS domain S-box-containing protein
MNNKTTTDEEKTQQNKTAWLSSFPEMNPWPIIEIVKNEITYINPAAKKLFPDLSEKQIDHPFLRGISDYFEKMNQTAIKNVEREIEVDGHWFLQSISLINADHLRLYASDITVHKKAEMVLTTREDIRYRRLFEAARDGILLVDFNTGMILDVNEFLINLLGYSKDDFLEKHLWDIGVFKDIAESKDKFLELQTKKYVRYDNLPLETKYGKKIAVEFVSYAYKVDETHMIQLIQCNVRDITERKKMEEKLTISELNYRRIFETAQDGILVIDADTGIILDVNQFLIDLLGYSKDDFLEKYLWDIGIFKDIVSSKENFLELQTKGYIRYENLPLETKDGRNINVEFISNVYEVSGKKSIQCSIRDITERVKREIILKEKTAQLERFNKSMIGRELKMVDLKERMKKFEKKIGEMTRKNSLSKTS